ncbi:hypothetical protein Q7P35_011927 [Cladosporium inversicolor]
MKDRTFDLDDPSDYKRLRDLIAPALSRYEQNGPPSARLEVVSRGDVPSKVPSRLIPSKYGDPSTWTQAEKHYNEDKRNLLVDAELRPFANAAQRTAAMVEVMLRHPDVFHPNRGVIRSLTGNNKAADSTGTSLVNIIMNAENDKLSSTADEKRNIVEGYKHCEEEEHCEERLINPVKESKSDDKSDGDDTSKLLRIVHELDTLLEQRLVIQKSIPSKPTNGADNSKTRKAENHYSRHLRQHIGKNNGSLAKRRKAKKFLGTGHSTTNLDYQGLID